MVAAIARTAGYLHNYSQFISIMMRPGAASLSHTAHGDSYVNTYMAASRIFDVPVQRCVENICM